LDANVHKSGRVEYHTLAPDWYLSVTNVPGFPILNPFFTHTAFIPPSTSNVHISSYDQYWTSRLVPVASPSKSTLESKKNFFPGVHVRAVGEIFRECVGGISSVRGDVILVPTSSILFEAFWCTTFAPSHAGMPTHILLVNDIDRRSGEVANIIVIWAVIHVTLFPLQIWVFDLSRG
jgi:hypothetical protein